MKNAPKLFSLLAGLLLLAAPVLRAQDAAPATPPADGDKPKHERRGGGGPGAMWDRAAKELDLTADQQAKWKDIADQEKAAVKPIMDDESLAPKDKRAKMMAAAKPFADQRRAVLTPDQQTKFDEMRAKMQQRGPRGPKKADADKPDGN